MGMRRISQAARWAVAGAGAPALRDASPVRRPALLWAHLAPCQSLTRLHGWHPPPQLHSQGNPLGSLPTTGRVHAVGWPPGALWPWRQADLSPEPPVRLSEWSRALQQCLVSASQTRHLIPPAWSALSLSWPHHHPCDSGGLPYRRLPLLSLRLLEVF